MASVPEKQVVSISTGGDETLITTTNSGAVYRLDGALTSKAEFRSAEKDVERFSKLGHYRIEGNDIDNCRLEVALRYDNIRPHAKVTRTRHYKLIDSTGSM